MFLSILKYETFQQERSNMKRAFTQSISSSVCVCLWDEHVYRAPVLCSARGQSRAIWWTAPCCTGSLQTCWERKRCCSLWCLWMLALFLRLSCFELLIKRSLEIMSTPSAGSFPSIDAVEAGRARKAGPLLRPSQWGPRLLSDNKMMESLLHPLDVVTCKRGTDELRFCSISEQAPGGGSGSQYICLGCPSWILQLA